MTDGTRRATRRWRGAPSTWLLALLTCTAACRPCPQNASSMPDACLVSVTRRHLTPEQRATFPPSGEIDNTTCVALCAEGDAIFTEGYDQDAYPFGLARCHVADLPLPQLVCEWAQHCYGRPQ